MDSWWTLSQRKRRGVDIIMPGVFVLHLGPQPWVPPCRSKAAGAVHRLQGKSGLLEKGLVRTGVSPQLPLNPQLSLPRLHRPPLPHH